MDPAAEWLEDAFDEFVEASRAFYTPNFNAMVGERLTRAYENYPFDQIDQPMFVLKKRGC